MHGDSLVFSVFLIFAGAAALASLALSTRQPLIVAYILLGMILGPFGMDLVADGKILESVGRIGIMFLLFLLGLDLHPRNFLTLLSRTTLVTVVSALLLGITGYLVTVASGFSPTEGVVIAVAIGFSSTIIGIKLLPTTVLHHKHVGELLVSILLVQDILAIVVLIVISGRAGEGADLMSFARLLLALPAVLAVSFAGVRWIVLPLVGRFDRFQEYIFLMAIGWCLSIAMLSESLGLSMEIGAFIAGIGLANSPIAQWIATNLKPLRDFFLILFFFTVGANINLGLIGQVLVPALVLTTVVILAKPVIYRYLLVMATEQSDSSWEVGWRLGQISEFSLLISYLALQTGLIGEAAATLLQTSAVMTFVISTYIVVMRYPSPIAISDRLRRD